MAGTGGRDRNQGGTVRSCSGLVLDQFMGASFGGVIRFGSVPIPEHLLSLGFAQQGEPADFLVGIIGDAL